MKLSELNQAIYDRLNNDGLLDAERGTTQSESECLGDSRVTMTVNGEPYCRYVVHCNPWDKYVTDLVFLRETRLAPRMHDGTAILTFKGINKFLRKREEQP